MQVSIEESGVIERKLTISVPHGEVDQEIAKRLHKVAQKARISGFRPGKAPQNIINKRYGAQITDEVVSDTINASYREALGKEEIVPAGLVSLEPKPFVAGDDLQYVATIELFPEVSCVTLEGRKIEQPVCAITDKDVEYTLQKICKQNAEFVPTDKKAQTDDQLTIDFEGKIDGQPFSGGAAQGHQFVLGEGNMLEAFESGLVGCKAGDSKQIAFTFPADYAAEVAGKAVKFAVEVKAVARAVLPQLDDAFAAKLGISDGMKKMRAEIEDSLQRELKLRMRSVMRDRVMDELVKVNPIEAPKALVESEIDHRIEALSARMEAQGIPKQKFAESIERERFADEARRQVVLGLIAHEVIEKSAIKADAEAVRARVEEIASTYDDGKSVIDWHYADPARLQQIEGLVLEEQMIARMLETADVTEKQVSFKELMERPPNIGSAA